MSAGESLGGGPEISRRLFGSGLLAVGAAALPARAQQAPSVAGPFKRARGGIPPANLDQIVASQRAVAESVFSKLRPYMVLPRAPARVPARFDWRDTHKVTPVKDQGVCGSCWAFAATGAYESAFLIANGLNAPISVSDQEGLDCAIPALYGCGGGWHDGVFRYIVQNGEVDTDAYPPGSYLGVKGACGGVSPRKYYANTFDFVGGATIPPDLDLKKALVAHGPLACGVSADRWDAQTGSQQSDPYRYSTRNPTWATDFPGGVFVGAPSTPGLSMQNGGAAGIDHMVLLIGWEDAPPGGPPGVGAWIVKNSWSEDWGDKGFMKLAYGTANVGFNAAWISARSVSLRLPSGVANRVLEINRYSNVF